MLMLSDARFQILCMARVKRPVAAPKKISMECHATSYPRSASFDKLRTNGCGFWPDSLAKR